MTQPGAGTWEERWHPLRREWVIVAAHRQDRPWQGERLDGGDAVAGAVAPLPQHDPACTFCPRNARVGGAHNPDYRGVYVFDNDRPCVAPHAPEPAAPPGLYRSRPARGLSRVVAFSERHDLRLSRMDVDAVDAVLAAYQEQYRELSARAGVVCVLPFENSGAVVGVSNPHPHGQVYATNFVFRMVQSQLDAGLEHRQRHGSNLWEDIVRTELDCGARVLGEHGSAVAFVPWFARYAYEVCVGPRRAVPSISDLDDAERRDLATALRAVLIRYDNLWRQPFPYVMVMHCAPCGAAAGEARARAAFGFHIELYPPLRKPALRKHLAGPELGGGNFLADTAPDAKAAELRAVPAVHYEDGPAAP